MFLELEGDFDITLGKWEPYENTVTEDLTKSTFDFRRDMVYLHPRTSMLMFGPKNATARQVQYLSIPGYADYKKRKNCGDDGWNEVKKVKSVFVVTVTVFEGIPMNDVFKVVQYWPFNGNECDNMKCSVKIACSIHILKSTMFKGQIAQGTREELSMLCKKYISFAKSHIDDCLANGGGGEGGEEEVQEDATSRAESAVPGSAPARKVSVGSASRRPSTKKVDATSGAHLSNSTSFVTHSPSSTLWTDNKILLIILVLLVVAMIILLFTFISHVKASDKLLTELLNAVVDINQKKCELHKW